MWRRNRTKRKEVTHLQNPCKYGIIKMNSKEKKLWYCCPICGKKLCRIDLESEAKNIYILCKHCRREICVTV